ncbi:MAG: RdgB/HAM1 family non-canonical purine NTP pyrophosphatase [Pseudomonadota bacterium]
MTVQLVLASGNAGKLRELSALLAPLPVTLVAQSALQIEGAEETGQTFVENAILKARHAAGESGCAALADDSGLVVPALGGAPGVYSARYAGAEPSDDDNIDALLSALADQSDRTAQFRCVMVMMRSARDPSPLICEGRWSGTIAQVRSGDAGFGYDPVFIPQGGDVSAATLSAAQKNAVSHRGQALAALLPMLRAEFGYAG